MRKLFPVFLNLEDRRILIIGGGSVALEKITSLLVTNARITVIAKSIKDEIKGIASDSGKIELIEREISKEDLEKKWTLIFSATNDSTLNANLVKTARENDILINSVDDPDNCDFFSAAVLDRGPIRVAVSTEGKFAGMAGMLKRILNEILPAEHDDEFLELMALRDEIKNSVTNIEDRRVILKKLITSLEMEYFRIKDMQGK